LVYTLTGLLPPPLDGSPEALHTRNHAAVAKVAVLLPVNANDIDSVMRLNAQYEWKVRTSLSAHARPMRVQALRQKPDAIDGAATRDAWTLHAAERSMQSVADPDAEWLEAVRSIAAPVRLKNATNSHDAAFETNPH
jgi:hypothetical protein